MSLLTDFQTVQAKVVRANDWCNLIFQHKPPHTQLQYLTMNGNQWITPGLTVDSNYVVEIKYLLTGSSKGMGRLLGSSVDQSFEMAASGTSAFRWGLNISSTTVSFTSGVPHTFKCYGTGQCYVDGVLKANLNKNQRPVTLFIFSESTHTEQVKGSFYYCKIWNNGVLIRDFIPVKDMNNVICLYDFVSGTYFYNSGSGSFTAGPEI